MLSRFVLALAATATFVAAPRALAQSVVADYRVQDTFNSSVGTIGPLVPVGAGMVTFNDATVDGQMQRVLTITTNSTAPGSDSGVQTQAVGVLNPANYSVVLLSDFVINPANVVATKIFDFKNLSTDAGLYVNAADGTLAFIDGMGVVQGTGGAAISSLEFVQVVLTRAAATGLTSIYLNGMPAFSFVDTTGLAILGDATATGNAFLTLYKDDGMGLGGSVLGEGTQGDIARLRLYDGVLSAGQVAGLDRAIPEPSTYALLVTGVLLVGAWRRRRQSAG